MKLTGNTIFITGLGTDADEILVERSRSLRANPGVNEHAFVNELNQHMVQLFSVAGSR